MGCKKEVRLLLACHVLYVILQPGEHIYTSSAFSGRVNCQLELTRVSVPLLLLWQLEMKQESSCIMCYSLPAFIILINAFDIVA